MLGELAALPPPVWPAMVSEFVTVVGKRPVAQLDPVSGVQGLAASIFHGPAIHPAPVLATEIEVYVLILRIATDLSMTPGQAGQAQVSIWRAAYDSHARREVELVLPGARPALTAEREYQARASPTVRIVRRHRYDLLFPGTFPGTFAELGDAPPANDQPVAAGPRAGWPPSRRRQAGSGHPLAAIPVPLA
jgi:hypothetical protein